MSGTMESKPNETLLVSIKPINRKSIDLEPPVGLLKSDEEILIKDETSGEVENNHSFVMSSHLTGKTEYDAIRLTEIPIQSKSSGTLGRRTKSLKQLSEIYVRDSNIIFDESTKDEVLSEDPKVKRTAFTETERRHAEEKDDDESSGSEGNTVLSKMTSNKRYYINYEGRLTLKETTLGPLKVFDSLDGKIEIALSMLEEILTKVTHANENKLLKEKLTLLKTFSSTSSTALSTKYVSVRERLQKVKKEQSTELNSKRSIKSKTSTKIPCIASVVKKLALPISVSKGKSYLDVKANVERVVLDDLVSKTNITSSESRDKEIEKDIQQEADSDVSSLESTLKKEDETGAPFEMRWCFGFNAKVPIVNLSTSDRSVMLFANSQFAVLHNFHENTMHFMQGHYNTVNCLASDLLGSLIVSADSGPNSRVIIWDTRPCVVAILEEVHPNGCQIVALSCYAEYLVTVSPPPQQSVQLWVWHENSGKPHGSVSINDNLGEIKKVTMNPTCAEEFVLTMESGVSFVYFDTRREETSDHDSLLLYSHQLSSKLGTFTDTTFLKTSALSSTTMGYVVVWLNGDGLQYKKLHEKHVRLHLEPITHIEAVDNLVAIVTLSGNVSFFDHGLTVLYWCNKLQLGALVSLSFHLWPQLEEVLPCSHQSHNTCAVSWRKDKQQLWDATTSSRPFSVRHFLVSTVGGRVAYVNPSSDVPEYLLCQSEAIYTAIDAHPHSQYICAGTSLSQCILLDIESFHVRVTQRLPTPEGLCQAVSQIRYSPSGLKLACGMYTGTVWLLDPLLLSPKHYSPLCYTSDCITHMIFSPQSDFLAVADTAQCVTVYSLQEVPVLVGQLQAHSRPVRDIFFVADGGELKLFSLGSDRSLIQFQVTDTLLTLKQIYRVEQSAIPYCILPYPFSDQLWLLINSENKFTLLDSQSLKCCNTFLAPQLGSPIYFLERFPNDSRFLVFGTHHHIGLHVLPLDGNPLKALAIRASSTPIVSCKIHHSGKYLFTISENCNVINVWNINSRVVMERYEKGGDGLDPFLTLVEKQEEENLREFFLVGQFVHQGEQPHVTRTLGNYLPTCEITNIFQALGFFPTKHQIENILHEVGLQKQVSFEEFVRLYVNHRPSHALTVQELHLAFRDLYEGVYFTDRDPALLRLETEPVFDTVSFVEKLMVTGEELTYPELYTALSILASNRTQTQPEDHHSGPSLPFMPRELSFETFFSDLLGFRLENNLAFEDLFS